MKKFCLLIASVLCYISITSFDIYSCGTSEGTTSQLNVSMNASNDAKAYVDLAFSDYLVADSYYAMLSRAYGKVERNGELKDACMRVIAARGTYQVTFNPQKDASACILYRIWDCHTMAEMVIRDIIWQYKDMGKRESLYRVVNILEGELEGEWLQKMLKKYSY